MNEFIIELQAKLDEAKSKENVNDDIDKLQTQLDKLKIKAEIDPKTISNLTKQLENIIGQKIVISNIGVDQNNITKAAQQTGKQIVNSINKEIESAGTVTNKILRDFSELNNAKRKFVDGHDLISKEEISDAERFYSTIKQAFSEFGQVTVTKGSLEDGTLESMRVKIQQVNGELKTTRDFMLYLNKNDDFGNGFKLVDDDTIRTSEKLIQHLNEEKNIINATGDEIEAQKQKLAEQEKYYKNIKNEVNNLYNLKTKLLSANELQTAELEKQIKQTKERISYNNKQIDKKDLRDNSLDRQINDLEVAKQKQLDLASAKSQDVVNTKELAQAEREAIAALKKRQTIEAQVNKIQLSIGDKGNVTTQVKTLRDNFTKLGLSADEVKSKMNGVDIELTELKSLLNSGANNSTIITQFDKMQSVLKETQNDLKSTRSEYSLLVSAQQRLNKANTIETWKQKNSAATKQAQADTQAYIDSLRNLNVQMTKMEFDQISRGFKETEISMRGLNKLGASLKDQFSQAAQSFTQWLSVSSVVMALVYQLKKIPEEVTKVNSAMIELEKVSNASASEIKKYFNEAAESAKKYGSSVSDMINATADFSRLGYSLPDSAELARVATLYKNVGDGIDITEASSSIVSTMKAFKIEAEDAISIVDKFNQVGNDFAISSGEIGDALKRSASSLAVAGNTISESIGLITAGKQNCLKNMETYFYRTYLIAREA